MEEELSTIDQYRAKVARLEQQADEAARVAKEAHLTRNAYPSLLVWRNILREQQKAEKQLERFIKDSKKACGNTQIQAMSQDEFLSQKRSNRPRRHDTNS